MAEKLPPKQRRFVQEYLVDLNATRAAIRAGYAFRDWAKAAGYYVYALVDPRNGEIFYIGKGRRRRYLAHYAEWKAGHVANAAKFTRIDGIAADGFTPNAVCLEDSLTEAAAYTMERQFIEVIGLQRLTNATPGQRSEREKEIASAQALLRRIKPYCVWASEAPRSLRDVEMYSRIVNEIKKIAEGDDWLSEITVTVGS